MGDVREGENEVSEAAKGKEDVVMDTPDRSKAQIGTPVSKFEESPVFNFLNNLSPIKTAKSASMTHTLNGLSFASLPSVFTSPHVSSLKESRFLRHQDLDPSKPEFSADTENKIMMDGGNERQEDADPKKSCPEVSNEMSIECSNPPGVGLVQSLNFDCTSSPSVFQTNTICSSDFMSYSDFATNSKEIVPFSHVISRNSLFGNETCREEVNMEDGSGGATGCDWESMSDVADLLSFDSPMDENNLKKCLGPDIDFFNNDLQNAQPLRSIRPGEEIETNNAASTQPGGIYREELSEMQEMLADTSLDINYMDRQNSNGELVSHLYRGVRRRCLVFEMSGARKKHLEENSTSSDSPILTQPPKGDSSVNENRLVPMRITNDSKCILPGIGLHLNALATTPKHHQGIKKDASTSSRLVIAPGSGLTSNFHSLNASQEQLNRQSLVMASTERDIDGDNAVLLLEDDGQASSVHLENEELNRNSPKKKKRRSEQVVEGESSCKRCNCKKSKCLKLYCECFAAGVYCVEPCSCQDCFNKPIHEETVLLTRKQIESRNPSAFLPKVIRSSDSHVETGDDLNMTPASARHKRGCNCKKSGCLKKYCECYQGGVGCSINCRCERCQNAFGRKDGSVFVATEIEVEDNELEEASEEVVKNISSHKALILADDGVHNDESAPPTTPFRFKRPSSSIAQPPLSSKRRPPRSSTSTLMASSSSVLGRLNFQQQQQSKFDKMQMEMVSQDEIPEILLLQGNLSPVVTGIIKSSSPNSKRVSPPHSESGGGGRMSTSSSPNKRSSRKLILQSIPSFPNLTPTKYH